MRRAFTIALFLAVSISSAGEDSYKNFYRVSDWKDPTLEGMAYYVDDYGNLESYSYNLKPTQKGSYYAEIYDPGGQDPSSAYWTAIEASVKAAEAMAEAQYARAEIDMFAKNLQKLLVSEGLTITDAQGETMTIKFNAGSLGRAMQSTMGGGDIGATTTDKFAGDVKTDGVTVEANADGKLQIKGGATAASSATAPWWDNSNFSVPVYTGQGLQWARYGGIDDAVFGTLVEDSLYLLTLQGWHGGACGETLSALLTDPENEVQRTAHEIICRHGTGDNRTIHYLPIGDLIQSGGGAPVDDASVTTNEANGATSQGVASLYDWNNAEDGDIPQKGDGVLKWTAPGDLVDDSSLACVEVGGESVFEVKGAHTYAGQSAKRYFGTDDSAALGWYELPNVTTNIVQGDEATISSNPAIPNVTPGDGVKILGLRGWSYAWSGDPVFLVNNGGVLDYIPFPAITNLAACACSNKWTSLLGWIGDGEPDVEHGINFTDQDLDTYLSNTLGFIKRVSVDWKSVGTNANGQVEVLGFSDASACSATMGNMLSDPSGSDATTHLLLAKKTDTGELHYVPIGDGVRAGAPVDGTSVTTNTSDGATSQGVASLFGWDDAGYGDAPRKGGDGKLEWFKIAGADGTSIVTNDGKLAIAGFDGTQVAGDFPVVNAEGTLEWVSTNALASSKFTGSFSYFDGHIHDGCVMVGRTPILVTGMDASSGDYRIRVTLGTSPTAVLEQGNGFTAPSGTTSYIPVYSLSNGEIVGDYRGSFVVPSYE